MPDAATIFLPDGITNNLAHELVTAALVHFAGSPSGITAKPELVPPDLVLRHCTGNYVKSLEDMAAAAVFGDKIAFTSKKLTTTNPDPKGFLAFLTAGAREVASNEKVVALDLEGEQLPAANLHANEDRSPRIADLLRQLETRGRSAPWQEHMVREAWMYPEKQWELTMGHLVGEVPDNYVDEMVGAVKCAFKNSQFAWQDAEKLRLFIKKNIVTHLTTYEWYLRVNTGRKEILYQAHATRATLDRDSEGTQSLDFVLPGIMLAVLKESKDPKDVVDTIATLATDGAFSDIRKALRGASSHPADVAAEIRRASQNHDFVSNAWLRLSGRRGLARIANDYVDYKEHTDEYKRLLCKIFPGLDRNRIRSPLRQDVSSV